MDGNSDVPQPETASDVQTLAPPLPKLFVYTNAAGLSAESALFLTQSGFLPILVDDVEQVRIMDVPMSVNLDGAALALISSAAIAAVRTSGTVVKEKFATAILELLAKKGA